MITLTAKMFLDAASLKYYHLYAAELRIEEIATNLFLWGLNLAQSLYELFSNPDERLWVNI